MPESFLYIGIGLMAVGIAFRQWAILVLGRFFSTTVRIVSDQKLVTRGPYHVVRHPSYTGALLILLGLGLGSRTWAGTMIILALFGLAYNYRINVEEKALKAELGQAYTDYAKKTKRLIPFVLWARISLLVGSHVLKTCLPKKLKINYKACSTQNRSSLTKWWYLTIPHEAIS